MSSSLPVTREWLTEETLQEGKPLPAVSKTEETTGSTQEDALKSKATIKP